MRRLLKSIRTRTLSNNYINSSNTSRINIHFFILPDLLTHARINFPCNLHQKYLEIKKTYSRWAALFATPDNILTGVNNRPARSAIPTKCPAPYKRTFPSGNATSTASRCP
jgi:hypothetical protein